MSKHETKFLDFFQKHIVVIGFLAVTTLGLLLRIFLFTLETADYSFFMKSWIDQLKEYPGISGIGKNIGEYNVPYMLFLAIIARTPFPDLYEIKTFSIIFDYIGAFAVLLILSHIRSTKLLSTEGLVAYSAILFSPVVFLNSAFWSQCDFIYVSMLLFCTYFMMKEHYSISMIFLGLSLALKLQSLFFFPVVLIYYFAKKNMKALNFLWIPIVFIILDLPAIFAGRGIIDTLTIYAKQTSIYENLTMNCPNVFVFFSGDYSIFSKVGIIMTLTILGLGACLLISKGSLQANKIILLATWSSLVCIYFLPAMHERYVFIACIFSVIWAFVSRKDYWIAIGINFVCFLNYVAYLFQVIIFDLKYLAIANLILLIAVTIRLFANNKKVLVSISDK